MNLTGEISREFLSAKDYAYEMIREKIWQFELQPGAAISEEQLRKTLEISRTPLREALSILEHEKLIIRQPNKRLKVSNISVKEVKEIFEVRAQLEKIAVAAATKNATTQDIENLKIIVNLLSQMTLENNLKQILDYGEKFHQYIYKMSQNETVQTILENLHNHVRRYRYLIISNKLAQFAGEQDEHALVLQAIQNGQGTQAAEIMVDHLEKSLKTAIVAIEAYKEEEK